MAESVNIPERLTGCWRVEIEGRKSVNLDNGRYSIPVNEMLLDALTISDAGEGGPRITVYNCLNHLPVFEVTEFDPKLGVLKVRLLQEGTNTVDLLR